MSLDIDRVRQVVRAALDEDLGRGDLTTLATVPESQRARGVLLAKQELVVAGLEVATGRAPVVCGKPSSVVFEQALAGLAADLGVKRLRAHDVAMVGDDPIADIAGAKRVGMRGVLVLTGKVDASAAEAAMSGPARSRPTAIANSLLDVVAALD